MLDNLSSPGCLISSKKLILAFYIRFGALHFLINNGIVFIAQFLLDKLFVFMVLFCGISATNSIYYYEVKSACSTFLETIVLLSC
ncbi:hypothetical protein QE382_003064 [Sphingobacterium zeae]|uniref:Uncharacterized protein n=1 Tax=Sphingobacterium zeae TaxID=1776859 RepID=A0ABU0U7Z4_9SPHI|nr:hypothetical protein [Sphingobacterium zeae]